MKLHIENFAKIQSADIEINGITVIAGENNTGKSTVGKIMFCLYSVFKDIDIKMNNERKRSIARALLSTKEINDKFFASLDRNDESFKIIETINELLSTDYHDLDKFYDSSEYNYSLQTKESLYETLSFQDKQLESLIINRYFDKEFKNQFLPLNNTEQTVLKLYIKQKVNDITFSNNQIIANNNLNLYKDCIYIDDPFLLDDIGIEHSNPYQDFMNLVFQGENVYDHRHFLISKLSQPLKGNNSDMISDALLDERLSTFQTMIKEVIQGDFIEKNKKFLFLDSHGQQEIELKNLSTGIKSLAILLKLIENREINDKSMVVLDEPEIHLHPKWQLKFAEILILMQKEFDLNIIITSHSPYFISAIQAYAKKHGSNDICEYYLSDLNHDDNAIFENVTNNVGKIFDKLSQPFDELDKIIYGD
ncbi:MAG: ATP-binding protein [Erysipelotrichaceae bacterium]|nr:ATP-binding protein [Erysipelotrichaceae bacterium]